MKKIYYILFSTYLLLLNVVSFAQDTAGSEDQPGMAVGMRADGKIYVVVAVVVTILLGLVVYLVNLDKKITRLEKEWKRGSGSVK